MQFKIGFIFFIIFTGLHAQTELDSIYEIWIDKTKSDSLRSSAYQEYIYSKYLNENIDSVLPKAENLYAFGDQQNFPLAKAMAFELKGEYYYEKGLLEKSLTNFQNAFTIIEKLGYEKDFVRLINTVGALNSDVGNSSLALNYFEKGLKISKEIEDKETMEMCVSNIGGIYYTLGNYDRALEYYQKGKTLEKEMGDLVGYASSLNLISRVLVDKGEIENARININEAIEIFKEQDEEYGILEAYFILGDIYTLKKDFKKALEYYEECENSEIVKSSPEFKAYLFNNMGNVFNALNNFNSAKSYCNSGLENANKSGIISEKINALSCLYKANRATKKNNLALTYLEQSLAFQDSLKTEDTSNKIQQMEVEKQAFNDSIQEAKRRFKLELAHQEEVQQKNRTRNIILVLSAFIVLIAIGLYSRWKSTQKSKAIIEKEKERSDHLLLNILPADIAKELKEKGKADARDFDLVSILFTDFKGFTEASEKLSAKALVSEINTCFKAFDHIIGKYHIEKIKTIGDAYMAAGGLPTPDDNAVKNTVLAGLEMQEFIIKRKQKLEKEGQVSFEMRVGIHTGPIVAGIVGVKKFQYDIWGDTVNTASRMESSGAVGKVNISQYTYELINNDPQFQFKHRGKLSAKGKGLVDMYFVKLK